jgi:excisionase family DNA binding protein
MTVEFDEAVAGALQRRVVFSGQVARRGEGVSPAPLRSAGGDAMGRGLDAGPEQLMTIDELAERLQYSVDWVRQQVRLGRIPAIKFNARAWRFHWPTVLRALHGLN